MRTVVLVQARLGSARLPGKCLRPLAGRPLIAHVLERALAVEADEVVLATSRSAGDDLLAEAALMEGVQVLRGDERDVLDRMLLAARASRADVVVRLTGDCPLLCPAVAGEVLRAYATPGVLYAWNDTARSGYPDGTDVEVFARDLLEQAARDARDPYDREHVTSWMRRRLEAPRDPDAPPSLATVALSTADWSALKLSVDDGADLERVRRVLDRVPRGRLTLDDTLAAAREAGLV